MKIIIKAAPRDYRRLRSYIPADSPAYEAMEKATRLDYSLDGVLFAGYSIPRDEEQARIILEIAKRCCPEVAKKSNMLCRALNMCKRIAAPRSRPNSY